MTSGTASLFSETTMAFVEVRQCVEGERFILVVLEQSDNAWDVALEWETRMGFCFRMSVETATLLRQRLTDLLASE